MSSTVGRDVTYSLLAGRVGALLWRIQAEAMAFQLPPEEIYDWQLKEVLGTDSPVWRRQAD
jgi:hypothetical protein